MDKHSLYYKIVEAFQNAEECPLCKLEESALFAFLDAFLYEAVTDPGARAELVKTRGYCNRHAHRLMNMRDKLGAAIVYQDQVKLYMDLFDRISQNELKPKKQSLAACANCPACRNQMETRRQYLNILSEGLFETELKKAYESSAGFCIPHLAALLETAKDRDMQIYLVQTERHHLAGLWDELEELIRKHDYRYRDESFGSESGSWRKAIKKIAGNMDNF